MDLSLLKMAMSLGGAIVLGFLTMGLWGLAFPTLIDSSNIEGTARVLCIVGCIASFFGALALVALAFS